MKVKRLSRVVPFGFKVCDDNSEYLEPIETELEALEKARDYAKTCSLRSVAAWLTATTGRYISHVGLRKILRERRNHYNTRQTPAT